MKAAAHGRRSGAGQTDGGIDSAPAYCIPMAVTGSQQASLQPRAPSDPPKRSAPTARPYSKAHRFSLARAASSSISRAAGDATACAYASAIRAARAPTAGAHSSPAARTHAVGSIADAMVRRSRW